MKEFYYRNKPFVLVALVTVVVIFGLVAYYGSPERAKRAIFNNERVVSENPTPRTISSATVFSGRSATSTGQNVALTSGVHLVIDGGKTLKEGYSLAAPVALQWSSDAKLVYIHSLGTVTLDGVSSGWEVAFGSKSMKKGYVLSVVGGVVIQKAEISSASAGYDVPVNWFDGDGAIRSIQTLSQFKDATINGLNFYYNEDGKRWVYAISTSRGVVPVPVR